MRPGGGAIRLAVPFDSDGCALGAGRSATGGQIECGVPRLMEALDQLADAVSALHTRLVSGFPTGLSCRYYQQRLGSSHQVEPLALTNRESSHSSCSLNASTDDFGAGPAIVSSPHSPVYHPCTPSATPLTTDPLTQVWLAWMVWHSL